MKVKMLLLITGVFGVGCAMAQNGSSGVANITVWNQTNKAMTLQCTPMPNLGVGIAPASTLQIEPNDSPALSVTYNQTGKVVMRCYNSDKSAWFSYTPLKNYNEKVLVSASGSVDQAQFYYNADYPGALIYK